MSARRLTTPSRSSRGAFHQRGGIPDGSVRAASKTGGDAIPTSRPRRRTGLVIVGLLVLGLLLVGVLGGGWWAVNNFILKEATATPTRPTATLTFTVTPTQTVTPLPPTATPTVVVSPSPTTLAGRIVDPSGVEMVLIPAGPFTMGSDFGGGDERPSHTVTLDAYYLDLHEVTNALYTKCEQAGVCQLPTGTSSTTHSSYYDNPEFADFPVIFVNWSMAEAYCEWRGGRLPTEAEWEKAARGDDERTFPWGEEINCTLANFWGGPGCAGDTTKVGSYPTGASPLACWIWLATCGSGSWTGMTRTFTPIPLLKTRRTRNGRLQDRARRFVDERRNPGAHHHPR